MNGGSNDLSERGMMGPSPEIGIPLGVLIGILSGLMGLALVGVLRRGVTLKDIPEVGGELAGIPTFWFGGSWLTGKMLESVPTADIVQSYMLALAATFVVIIVKPLFNFVVQKGEVAGGRPIAND
jgi:hypothetical protein